MSEHAVCGRRVALVFGCAILWAPIAVAETVTPANQVVNPLAFGQPSRLENFLGRPLFSLSRRPAAAHEDHAVETIEQTATAPDFHLLGVVQMVDENVAQVSDGAASQRYSVQVGDYLGDWQVSKIEKESLILTNGAQELKLTLFAHRDQETGSELRGSDSYISDKSGHADTLSSPNSEQRWTHDDLKGFFGDIR